MIRFIKSLQHYKKPFNMIGSRKKSISSIDIQPASQKTITKKSPGPEILKLTEKKFSPGQEYHNFLCTRAENIPEFCLTSYLFKHNKTGTQLWYLDRDDPNNVFSVNFRTTPYDSTGLPHILEHSVLCGSKNYPVRDPFFKMLNRSVATFMNAMTGPDYTLYPFSSMNETDYRNLQKIYLDAVFRPNLQYLDFLQEGWRLEHTNLTDKSSDYIIKGVVYNEMKGAFSENSSIFAEQLLHSILPDHTYGNCSGGNPLEIPKLTHQNLVDFHQKYYHPSNSRIYCYGSFGLDKTLSFINEEYLNKYDKIDNCYSEIPSQKRWTKPRNVHVSSRFDNMGAPFDKQNQITIALLMSDITDIYETFVLHILTALLIKGPNSYFYKSLIEPNFSGGYNQTTGFDPQVKDTLLSVGLQDIKVEDFGRVQDIFDATINNVITNGFEKDHIESVLHNIELSLKHQTPQFGIGLLFNTTPLWNHDGDTFSSLKVEELIRKFRQSLESDEKYLENKVKHYFQDNQHRLTLTMSPDDHYEENFQTAEKSLLSDKIINLTDVNKLEIYENGLKLEKSQKAPSNVELLPCLSIDDVKKPPPEPYTLDVININNVPTQYCTLPTNGISYLKLCFDSTALTDDEIKLLPLFCEVINEMGTKNYDFRTFDKIITTSTSGIAFRLHFSENIYDSKTYNLGILMTTHALDFNITKMFDLSHELLMNYEMNDLKRLTMLIENYQSSLSVGIANSGHLYAMQSCNGLVTDAAKLKSLLGGVEHIDFMKNLTKTQKPEEIMEILDNIGKKLFNSNTMRGCLNTSEEFYPNLIENYDKFIKTLPKTEKSSDQEKRINSINLLEPSNQHFIMNIPVNYCAKSFMAVPYTHQDHPTLRLLAKILSAKYLLPVVREQNGAYGSGAKLSLDGIFNFFSYRDPNSRKTLDVFDETYEWLQGNLKMINEQTLFEAKLGVLQQLDSPIAPGNKGSDFFLYGVSQQIFKKYRQQMLNITVTDVHKVIEQYFKNEPKHYGRTVLGPKNSDLQKDNEKWTTIGN